MTLIKKTRINQTSAYKTEAAARRAKIALIITPIAGEVKPSQGRIQVTLTGKAISRERQATVFGTSEINIPEFSPVRKRKST